MFDRDQRAEIRSLCHEELRLIHRANQAQGSYRYLCMLDGQPIYSHTPVGEVIRDLEQEPDL
jgi:hypothetical protein